MTLRTKKLFTSFKRGKDFYFIRVKRAIQIKDAKMMAMFFDMTQVQFDNIAADYSFNNFM